MSLGLVSYGSSDESSDEDVDQPEIVSTRPRPGQSIGQQSEADDNGSNNGRSEVVNSVTSSIVRPKLTDISTGESSSGVTPGLKVVDLNKTEQLNVNEPLKRRSSLLSSLPAPKSFKPVKDLHRKPVIGHDNKTKSVVHDSSNVKQSFLNLPPPKTKNNTIKITLPSLPDPGSDDDEPIAKKPTPKKGVSGLLSILPKPRSSMSSRILVPHTVSRKQQPKQLPVKQPSKAPPKTTNKPSINTDYGGGGGSSDDDADEKDSFFSLGASTKPILPSNISSQEKPFSKMRLPSLKHETVNINYLKELSNDNVKHSDKYKLLETADNLVPKSSSILPESNLNLSASTKSTGTSIKSSHINPQNASISRTESDPAENLADAPLSFNKSHASTAKGYGHAASSYYDYSANYYQEGQSSNYYPEGYSSYEYNQPYQDSGEYDETSTDSTVVENTQLESVQDMNEDDDQFRRFLGKKRGREDINMISISADDQTAGSNTRETLLKSISEEKQPMSYSKKKNADLPSQQQRRKHQITYLAFQAKERELALKNQWSQNRMTRKQTQAKYGF